MDWQCPSKCDGFKWAEPTLNGLNDTDITSPIGRVYEVDNSYPGHFHYDHCDFLAFPPRKFDSDRIESQKADGHI